MANNFIPTHKIKLSNKQTVSHNFINGEEVKIQPEIIIGGGTMVMATNKDGMTQFVSYEELKLIVTKKK